MVCDQPESCAELTSALGSLGVETRIAKNSVEAQEITRREQPLLAFVDLNVWQQSSMELVKMASNPEQILNIIVIGQLPDIEKYVSAIEKGAFNFIAPPFVSDILSLVVRTAAEDAGERRKLLARVPLSHAAG